MPMIIKRSKDLRVFLERPKIAFVFFFDDFCQEITTNVDNFFKEKYDLNKMYIKVKVSDAPRIVEELDITTYPIIKIYNHMKCVGELYCNNDNLLENLEKLYANIV
jgi:hypothetical protein